MKQLLLICLMMVSACEPAHAFGRKSPGAYNPSTSSTHPSPGPSAFAIPSPSPLVVASPLPAASPLPLARIMLGTITGAQAGEIEMVHMGITIANRTLDSSCYLQWVGAAHYTENNGLTGQQIATLQATQVNKVDVEMYYENNRVVGFEYDPYDGVVHMNRKFVNTPYMVADNILHEDRGHGLGFHHYGTFSTSEPYGANYAFEGCTKQQMLARGSRASKAYRPPGIRIQVRHKKVKHG